MTSLGAQPQQQGTGPGLVLNQGNGVPTPGQAALPVPPQLGGVQDAVSQMTPGTPGAGGTATAGNAQAAELALGPDSGAAPSTMPLGGAPAEGGQPADPQAGQDALAQISSTEGAAGWQPGATGQPVYPMGEGPLTQTVPPMMPGMMAPKTAGAAGRVAGTLLGFTGDAAATLAGSPSHGRFSAYGGRTGSALQDKLMGRKKRDEKDEKTEEKEAGELPIPDQAITAAIGATAGPKVNPSLSKWRQNQKHTIVGDGKIDSARSTMGRDGKSINYSTTGLGGGLGTKGKKLKFNTGVTPGKKYDKYTTPTRGHKPSQPTYTVPWNQPAAAKKPAPYVDPAAPPKIASTTLLGTPGLRRDLTGSGSRTGTTKAASGSLVVGNGIKQGSDPLEVVNLRSVATKDRHNGQVRQPRYHDDGSTSAPGPSNLVDSTHPPRTDKLAYEGLRQSAVGEGNFDIKEKPWSLQGEDAWPTKDERATGKSEDERGQTQTKISELIVAATSDAGRGFLAECVKQGHSVDEIRMLAVKASELSDVVADDLAFLTKEAGKKGLISGAITRGRKLIGLGPKTGIKPVAGTVAKKAPGVISKMKTRAYDALSGFNMNKMPGFKKKVPVKPKVKPQKVELGGPPNVTQTATPKAKLTPEVRTRPPGAHGASQSRAAGNVLEEAGPKVPTTVLPQPKMKGQGAYRTTGKTKGPAPTTQAPGGFVGDTGKGLSGDALAHGTSRSTVNMLPQTAKAVGKDYGLRESLMTPAKGWLRRNIVKGPKTRAKKWLQQHPKTRTAVNLAASPIKPGLQLGTVGLGAHGINTYAIPAITGNPPPLGDSSDWGEKGLYLGGASGPLNKIPGVKQVMDKGKQLLAPAGKRMMQAGVGTVLLDGGRGVGDAEGYERGGQEGFQQGYERGGQEGFQQGGQVGLDQGRAEGKVIIERMMADPSQIPKVVAEGARNPEALAEKPSLKEWFVAKVDKLWGAVDPAQAKEADELLNKAHALTDIPLEEWNDMDAGVKLKALNADPKLNALFKEAKKIQEAGGLSAESGNNFLMPLLVMAGLKKGNFLYDFVAKMDGTQAGFLVAGLGSALVGLIGAMTGNKGLAVLGIGAGLLMGGYAAKDQLFGAKDPTAIDSETMNDVTNMIPDEPQQQQAGLMMNQPSPFGDQISNWQRATGDMQATPT